MAIVDDHRDNSTTDPLRTTSCGWRLIRDGRAADEESIQATGAISASRAAPMSGARISDSPTSTA